MKNSLTKLLAIGCLAAGQISFGADPKPADKDGQNEAAVNGSVKIEIHTPDGVEKQEAEFNSLTDGQVIIIGGTDVEVEELGNGQHAIHIQMLKDMADKMPENNKHAREHLEKHLMQLLSQGQKTPGGHHQVMSFSTASAQSVIDDGEHRISLTSKDGSKELHVTTSDGKEIYKGPWNTKADKKKVSPEIREKVDNHQAATHFEVKINDFDNDAFNGKVPDHPLFQNLTPAKKDRDERKRNKPTNLRDNDGRRVY